MDTLTALGTKYGTDKVTHGFCAFYDRHLAGRRQSVSKVLEIGVFRGASLRMWRDYFPTAEIHGFDQRLPEGTLPSRIHLHRGDQAKPADLDGLMQRVGSRLDLVIDDGGHTMEQQQVTLAHLFPHVCSGGLYIVEDLHTSFFPRINLFRDGEIVGGYPTGAEGCSRTSYELVDALIEDRRVSSEFISEPEMDEIVRELEGGEIFDRDGDHGHVTAILRKR